MFSYIRFLGRAGAWRMAGARRWTLAAAAAGPLLAGAVPLAVSLGAPAPVGGSAASSSAPAEPGTGVTTAPRSRGVTGRRPGASRTSCRSVAHIGDSTSVGLVSPATLPSPASRLAARYAQAGVGRLHVAASGGRSIVERLPGQANGYQVAASLVRRGYRAAG